MRALLVFVVKQEFNFHWYTGERKIKTEEKVSAFLRSALSMYNKEFSLPCMMGELHIQIILQESTIDDIIWQSVGLYIECPGNKGKG